VAAEVYRSVNVSAHPDLRQRILSEEPDKAINTVRCPEREQPRLVDLPVIYHDPDHELFILVLPESSRHRELSERAELLAAVAADPSPVPAYVRDFIVVFGIAALRARVEESAQKVIRQARDAERAMELRRERDALEQTRIALDTRSAALDLRADDLDRRDKELARREGELAHGEGELERRDKELARREGELAHGEGELARREGDLVRREGDLVAEQREIDERARSLQIAEKALSDRVTRAESGGTPEARDDRTLVVALSSKSPSADEAHTTPFNLFELDELEAEADDPHCGLSARTTEVSQVTELDASEAIELIGGEVVVADQPADSSPSRRDPVAKEAVSRWIDSGQPFAVFVDESGQPRACVTASASEADMLLGQHLDLRVQLHRLPSYPLVTLALGTPASLSGRGGARPVALALDPGDDGDRQVLNVLARDFTFLLEVYDAAYSLRRQRRVTAGLEDNVTLVLEAADAHLLAIPSRLRSFAKARSTWSNPEFDRYGWNHPEWSELREDKLMDLSSAQCVRRALAIADRFSSARREEFLFMLRGYPIRLWNAQRRAVLARAIDLGIWVGARLAPIAIDEGLARSREDLVKRLKENFTRLQADHDANDLDPDAASDNWAALELETGAARLDWPVTGKRRTPRLTPISSTSKVQVSGTIAGATRAAISSSSPRNLSNDDLLAQLSRDEMRVEAAIELARRREQRAVPPIMNILSHLNRLDAVRILGVMPSFGDPATQTLIQGLDSHKSFVRQGCALALAVLKNETALEALSDLVITEPTDLWREVARGLGTVGPSAIMPLVSRLSAANDAARERVAWALAHIAAIGGKKQVRQLAGGRDPIAAAVARHALELMTVAKLDDLQVRGRHTPKEQTVNRAFSRKFFQALEASTPMVDASATAEGPEMSSPAMVLDEADLLEATEYNAPEHGASDGDEAESSAGKDADDDEPAELLDDSDLIPT
jgi:hypothetical protein